MNLIFVYLQLPLAVVFLLKESLRAKLTIMEGKVAQILVIDDEDIVRKSICKMLEAEGHTVREAKSGNEGITNFKQQPPDLLITDILMPDKDGLEVIRELRVSHPLVKILAITGGGATGELNFLPQAKAFGAHATLNKPFLRDELLEAIDEIM